MSTIQPPPKVVLKSTTKVSLNDRWGGSIFFSQICHQFGASKLVHTQSWSIMFEISALWIDQTVWIHSEKWIKIITRKPMYASKSASNTEKCNQKKMLHEKKESAQKDLDWNTYNTLCGDTAGVQVIAMKKKLKWNDEKKKMMRECQISKRNQRISAHVSVIVCMSWTWKKDKRSYCSWHSD